MQYIFAESLKELEIRYKTRQKVEIFANLDSELECVIFKNKHLFENEEIDYWISIDPYGDTLIKTENIQYLLKFGKKLQDKDVLNKFNSSTTQETTTTKTTMKQEKIIRIIAENPYVSEKMEEKK